MILKVQTSSNNTPVYRYGYGFHLSTSILDFYPNPSPSPHLHLRLYLARTTSVLRHLKFTRTCTCTRASFSESFRAHTWVFQFFSVPVPLLLTHTLYPYPKKYHTGLIELVIIANLSKHFENTTHRRKLYNQLVKHPNIRKKILRYVKILHCWLLLLLLARYWQRWTYIITQCFFFGGLTFPLGQIFGALGQKKLYLFSPVKNITFFLNAKYLV